MAGTVLGERRLGCCDPASNIALDRAYALALMADPIPAPAQWAALGKYYRTCSPRHAGLVIRTLAAHVPRFPKLDCSHQGTLRLLWNIARSHAEPPQELD